MHVEVVPVGPTVHLQLQVAPSPVSYNLFQFSADATDSCNSSNTFAVSLFSNNQNITLTNTHTQYCCLFVQFHAPSQGYRVPVWVQNNLSGKSNKREQFWGLLSCDNLTRTSAKICKISYKTLRPARPDLIFAVFQINMHRRMKGFQAVSLPYAILDLLRPDTKLLIF